MVQIVLQSEPQRDRQPEPSPQPRERVRLEEDRAGLAAWKRWGPYLSERQWGTVREDYSADGDAWDYFPHDHARSRAYRWGEDGLAGIQRRRAAALPGAGAVERPRPDPQGAPVRPDQRRGQPRRGRQGAVLLPRRHADALVPEDALQVSAARVSLRAAGRGEPPPRHATQPEFELLDTGVFDDDRYFDVFVEYAKAGAGRHADARHRRTTAARRPPTLHLLPQLWFRNTWSWTRGRARSRRSIAAGRRCDRASEHRELGRLSLVLRRRAGAAVLRERDQRAAGSTASTDADGYFKDAFHEYVVHGDATRSTRERTRHQGGGALSRSTVPAGGSVRVRAAADDRRRCATPFADFDERLRAAARARPTSSTPDCSADIDRRRRAAGAAAGVRRHDLEQAVLLLRRAASG